jgi:hypothetical protein
MLLSATSEDIKAHQEKIEKNEITSEDLPSCSHCELESKFFKIHAYRERRFLIIVDLLVQAVFCALVRFKCTDCGKTFSCYPDFAVPHKHYTRQTIENFSNSYVEDDHKTYKDATAIDMAVPERQDCGQHLSPSTIHRWVTTVADLFIEIQKKAAKKLSQQFCLYHSHLTISKKKYRTKKRRMCLLRSRLFFESSSFVKKSVSPSLE